MVWIICRPKTFESEKQFMHEVSLRSLMVGVRLQRLQAKMQLHPVQTGAPESR